MTLINLPLLFLSNQTNKENWHGILYFGLLITCLGQWPSADLVSLNASLLLYAYLSSSLTFDHSLFPTVSPIEHDGFISLCMLSSVKPTGDRSILIYSGGLRRQVLYDQME